MKSTKSVYLFILPAALFFSVFFLLPLLQVFYNSFRDENLITQGTFIGLDNYSALLADPLFWRTLLNSFLYILVTPILIVVSLALALAVRSNTKVNRFFRSAFFFPVLTPLVSAGILWKWIFAEDAGVLNYVFGLVGLHNVQWLSSFPENMLSVMIITIWKGAGYYMMIFLAGFAIINPELEEAAMLDGAGYVSRLRHILIPQLTPTILMVLVISSIAAVKLFAELYILIPGAPMAQKTIISLLYREAFEKFSMGYGSAIGVMVFLCTALLSVANVRLLERSYKQ